MPKLMIILLLALVIAALLLPGCAQSTPAPAPAPSAGQPSASAAPKPAGSPTTTAPAASKPASGAAAPIELRFSHHNPPLHPTTVKFLNAWAKKAEDATNGRIKIVMYPAESLANSRQNLQAVQSGLADIGWLTLSNYPGAFPLSEVITLPFMCLQSGRINGREVFGGEVTSHITQELYESSPEVQNEWKSVKVLFLQTTDPNVFETKRKPIKTVDDLKGLKIAAFGGAYTIAMWKNMGAAPLSLPMPDVYDAAQKGVVDGAHTPWVAVNGNKLYEVFKYFNQMAPLTSILPVVMNNDSWNNLPPDIQKAIMSVSGIAGAEFAGASAFGADVKQTTLAVAKKAGYDIEEVTLNPGEMDKWKELAGKPLWDKWAAEMQAKGLPGKKILDLTLQIIDKYR